MFVRNVAYSMLLDHLIVLAADVIAESLYESLIVMKVRQLRE